MVSRNIEQELPQINQQDIESFLHRIRVRCLAVQILKTLSLALTGLLIWAFFIAILPSVGVGRFSSRGLWFLGLFFSGIYVVYSFAKSLQSLKDQSLSRKVEEWEPSTQGFLTALELSREFEQLRKKPLYSANLAAARIEQVRKVIKKTSVLDIVPVEALRLRSIFLFVTAAIFFVAVLAFPGKSSQFLHQLFYKPFQKSAKLQPPPGGELVVGDLEITYNYPKYTKLRSRTIPNSDGALAAYKGTQVQIRARAMFPTAGAEILLNNQERVKLQVGADKRSLVGKFTILRQGFYRFQLLSEKAHQRLGPAHIILLRADQYPKVKWLSKNHTPELQERAKLHLSYEFSDDFGASKINIVYQVASKHSKEKRFQIEHLKGHPKEGKGTYRWDLSTTPFSPGDQVSYQIEIYDNDTVTGPKRTRSEKRSFKLYSPLEHHDRLLAMQEKLLDRMLQFLADLLEHPKAQKHEGKRLRRHIGLLNTRGGVLQKTFLRLQKELQTDPLIKSYALIALENLRIRFILRHNQRLELTDRMGFTRQDRPFEKDAYSDLHVEETPLQEDDVYAFSLLLNRQRLDMLAHLSKKLTTSQNRLRDLLEQYRKKRDPKTKQALMQEMRRIERLIKQIMRRMQKLSRQIPDEHLNMKAFKKKNSLQQLKKMKQAIKKDNLEDAAKRLSKLARSVERMVSQMENYRRKAGGSSLSRMAAAVKKLIDNLHQLEKKQQRLSQKTQKVRKQLAKRMQKALKKKMKALINKQLARILQIQKSLKSAKGSMKDYLRTYRYGRKFKAMSHHLVQLEKLLKLGDIYESLQTIRGFQHSIQNAQITLRYQRQSLQFQKRSLQRQIKYLQGMDAKAAKERLFKQLKSVTSAAKDIKIAQTKGELIEKDLERFFPSPKPYMTKKERRLMRRYQKSQQQLRQEGKKLQQQMQRMGKRLPIFRPKMKQGLRQALEEMGSAQDQLGQQEPRPAYKHQQQAISKLQQVRKQLKSSMKKQKKRGGKGKQSRRRRNKVKIPDASSHKAPKALRQDILKAMKEKLPHRYREPVRRYYEKLVK